MQISEENTNSELTFEQVLGKYSHIRLATQEDNQAILDFYKNEVMQTSAESVSFARDPDFFAFYRQTTEIFWTFLFLNDDQTIGGMGTVLRHIRFINGAFRPVAYFCDLRISSNAGRRAKLQWRQFFPDCISSIKILKEDQRCISAYTAILAANDLAIASLTKSGRGITYRYLNTYNVQSYVSTGLVHSQKFYAKEISLLEFTKFYKENVGMNFLAQDTSDLVNTISSMNKLSKKFILLGVFKKDKLYAITAVSINNVSRRLKILNLSGAKLLASKAFKFTFKEAITSDGEMSVSDLVFTCFKHKELNKDPDTAFREEMIESIFSYLDKKKLTRTSHILNLYLNERVIENDLLKRGISFITKGHLFEIHAEGEESVLPKTTFRFEGALL